MADPSFAARARLIAVPPALDRLPRGPFRPGDELLLLLRVLCAALKSPNLLLFSSRGYCKPELLAIILLGLLPARLRPRIVLYGEMFQPSGGMLGRIERMVMALARRAVDRYITFSQAEQQVLAENWGVDPARVRFCPFFFVPRPNAAPAAEDPPPAPGGHVFAGGNSFRDYEALIAAARQLPDVTFYIGTIRLADRTDLPPNVHAAWFDRAEWNRLVRTAAVVVVPLRRDLRRTAGLLTLLDAMWNRSFLVVTDALGVRDYVTDQGTGLVVEGTPASYVKALRWALEPANRTTVDAMVEAGHRDVGERFTLANHCAAFLAVLDELHERVRQPDAGLVKQAS